MAADLMQKIKKLREITDAPFIDCKKALEQTGADLDKAVAWLQENGKTKALKKADRIAAEGLVFATKNETHGVIVELNSETDFVAKNKNFVELLHLILQTLLENEFSSDQEAFKLKTKTGKSIEDSITDATATIGEKISLRRFEKVAIKSDEQLGVYIHHNGQIASIVLIKSEKEAVAKNIAMHVAALNPEYIFVKDVPQEQIKKLEQEFKASPALAGKPEKIQENILRGMMNKELAKYVLVAQEYALEQQYTVQKYLETNHSELLKVVRFEVGEGIEKQSVDFAQEVAAQIKESQK
ncbi:elongation factor Ts [Mycoplasma hyorhinis]|uniref:translation elongation factor Ts n=1 Tax=Mesomycoplasma hyorhinis TaxID=2100 RepID=UPI00136B8528|nr:translation elongation factor Ts [Mesomycoplasma hyorhinis]MXR09540.1 elongation factor Ts [Mesomycoplasma hyorhinis]MXR11591.1 elongation factor Ts [Mesomycoplasma hyorhinis]